MARIKQLPATLPCTGNIALQTRGGARRQIADKDKVGSCLLKSGMCGHNYKGGKYAISLR